MAQKKTPGASGKKAAAPPKETKAPPAKPSPRPSPQMGSLVSKVMELADAGVGLGINVISLLNTLARSQVAGAAPAEQQPQDDERRPAPPEDAPHAEAPRNYCIVNRRPIHPGGAVQVSFSINNDLPDAPKKLHVTTQGFVGAARGFSLDGAGFSVKPSMHMRTIALTGEGGGSLAPLTDFLLAVPSRRTPLIQQVHLCLYHYLCEQVERRLMAI